MSKKSYERYVVVGSKKMVEHPYSTKLGNQIALNFAIECADHPAMQGLVYGEDVSGSRTLVYKHEVK